MGSLIMKIELPSAAQNLVLTFFMWIGFTLLSCLFLDGYKYILAGSLTMIFCVTIIYFAVKSIINEKNIIWALFAMFSKYPIVAVSMFMLSKQPDFNAISYAVGLLNVLPCIVILSYRRPIN